MYSFLCLTSNFFDISISGSGSQSFAVDIVGCGENWMGSNVRDGCWLVWLPSFKAGSLQLDLEQ